MPGLDEERILLLVLRPPDLEHRKRAVAHLNAADVYLRSGRVHDLLHHVAVAARSLVVYAADRVLPAQFHAGADHTVQLLLHLRVAALHRVEVELRDVLPLDHGGGRAAAHADAVGRAAYLDHEHSFSGLRLFYMAGVHLADAAGKHDRLDPLPPLAAGQPQAKGAREPLDHGLAELVAVVGGSVAGLDLDLERRCKIIRI